MSKKLFIPGPIDVREEVLQKMATPMIGHRGKDASMLQKSISEKMQNYSIQTTRYFYPRHPNWFNGRLHSFLYIQKGSSIFLWILW